MHGPTGGGVGALSLLPPPADEDIDMMDIDEAPSSPPAQTPAAIHEQEEPKKGGSSFPLSQLLFIVGHVVGKAYSRPRLKQDSNSQHSQTVCPSGTH